jgi:hypothetical protein
MEQDNYDDEILVGDKRVRGIGYIDKPPFIVSTIPNYMMHS